MVVTERLASGLIRFGIAVLSGWLLSTSLLAATLPVDKVDMLYHRYEGGGMVIDGPSVLVRKSVGPQVSVSGQYYVDQVSAASVDVLATASEYEEERTEYTAGIDYLYEKSILSLGFTQSTENDYEANTVYFSVSQEFFGGMSTLTLGYANGWDEVRERGNETFEAEADRRNYQLGLSQVLTTNSLVGFDLEVVTDEGFLQNPYRQNRYIDPNNSNNFLYQPERYPETRTSYSLAVRALYYLPYRASVRAEYRFFSDTWGIDSHTYELAYVHALNPRWSLEGKARFYDQDQADFYSDLYAFENSQTHLARDKEMSSFSGITLGGGVVYEWKQTSLPGIDRLQASLLVDWLDFEYDNFRDVTAPGNFAPGEEPLYAFDAFVTRASLILEY
ncbi:DUF3570 domain-containing protein [Marinobacter sp. CHS3-4]|uniref:DUF3570 domain-containing protein n=1 Tax=Marinobacter sp. CHS3-4 TaxID=3045174 RepID=UPI0024B5F973|nr:DUF3570 domain-containing protein [Marinobacter sp. CHS3-4]MDI9245742.1 DUF3570 domain-containing protein [Marinobacter sp. CHS3-4]